MWRNRRVNEVDVGLLMEGIFSLVAKRGALIRGYTGFHRCGCHLWDRGVPIEKWLTEVDSRANLKVSSACPRVHGSKNQENRDPKMIWHCNGTIE